MTESEEGRQQMKKQKMMKLCLALVMLLGACTKQDSHTENTPEPSPSPQTQETAEPAASVIPENTPEVTPEPSEETEETDTVSLEEYRRDYEPKAGTDLFGVCEVPLNDEERQIYGWLYLPYEDKESYPLVILCHGFQSGFYDLADQAGKYVDAGMAAYVFDFCGGSTYCKSSGDILHMSVRTELDDLNLVLDELRKFEFLDKNNTFLLGESQGGLVSAMLAAQRPQDIAGMVLLYPAFVIPDMARETYTDEQHLPEVPYAFNVPVGWPYYQDVFDMDVWEETRGYEGPVLMIHGSADTIVPISYSEQALDFYPEGELRVMEGAGHGFEGEQQEEVYRMTVEFVQEHVK